jgi:hypothetical protein
VVILVVAFSKNGLVFFYRPVWVVEAMCSVEVLLPENRYFHVMTIKTN